jgi:hypothetical protein
MTSKGVHRATGVILLARASGQAGDAQRAPSERSHRDLCLSPVEESLRKLKKPPRTSELVRSIRGRTETKWICVCVQRLTTSKAPVKFKFPLPLRKAILRTEQLTCTAHDGSHHEPEIPPYQPACHSGSEGQLTLPLAT